jgi:hypothetical protein
MFVRFMAPLYTVMHHCLLALSLIIVIRASGIGQVYLVPTGPGPIIKWLSATGRMLGREQQELTFEFENDFLRVQMEGIKTVEISSLTHQRAGRVVLAAHRSEVLVDSAEVICRDTIEWEGFR